MDYQGRSRIGVEFVDWRWIGIGSEIGMGMEDWSRIDTGLAMDWRWIGGSVKDWWFVPGLTPELRICDGLAMN